jgi:hypothetical protein
MIDVRTFLFLSTFTLRWVRTEDELENRRGLPLRAMAFVDNEDEWFINVFIFLLISRDGRAWTGCHPLPARVIVSNNGEAKDVISCSVCVCVCSSSIFLLHSKCINTHQCNSSNSKSTLTIFYALLSLARRLWVYCIVHTNTHTNSKNGENCYVARKKRQLSK